MIFFFFLAYSYSPWEYSGDRVIYKGSNTAGLGSALSARYG